MIYDLVKKYGGTEDTMKVLAEALEEHLSKEDYEELSKQIYESTQGKHFDEAFAKKQISKMYYEENGVRHYAPYWEGLSTIYSANKRKLEFPYNRWDWEVTMNMIKSDYCPLLKRWFPDEKDMIDKIIDLTINWLNDEDNPFGESKIWCYFR